MVSQHSAKLGGYRNCVGGGKFLVVEEEDPHARLNPQLLFISKAHGMKHITSHVQHWSLATKATINET